MSGGRREVVIGLDVGTSRVKAVGMRLEGDEQVVVVRDQPARSTAADRDEVDPDALLTATRDALRECVAGLHGVEVVAVAVAAAMHGLVGVDGSGRPLTPLLTFADGRAAAEAAELASAPDAAGLHSATGVPAHPMAPLAKLRWIAGHHPGVAAEVRTWLGVGEWVSLWLTGVAASVPSWAGGTGLLDLATGGWHGPALDAADVVADRLPRLEPGPVVLRMATAAAAEVDLPAGTPVVLAGADGPLGNLGMGATPAGVAGVSIGTSAALRVAVDRPVVGDGLFCYPLVPGTWVAGGAVSNGGGAVGLMDRVLTPGGRGGGRGGGGGRAAASGAIDELLDRAATVPPGSDGVVVVPYLLPERAPLWDPALPGAVLGLRAHHGRAHLTRATVEGVCIQLAVVAERLGAIVPLREVRATGGALVHPLWRRSLAAALDLPVRLVDGVEGTALGAAAVGLAAVGRATSPVAAADDLLGRFALLTDVTPDPAEVAALRRTRAHLADLVQGLTRITAAVTQPGA